jgi:hypothetical protein
VSDRTVTDEQILGGFADLHQVIATGFDAMRAEMHAMRLDDHERRIGALEARS